MQYHVPIAAREDAWRVRRYLAALVLLVCAAALTACEVAWSPDGKRILIPYLDPATGGYAVALHDLPSGRTRRVFALPKASRIGGIVVRWLTTEQAIVLHNTGKPGEVDATILDVATSRPVRTFRVSLGDQYWQTNNMRPPVLEGRYVFLSDGKRVIRLDAKTGAVARSAELKYILVLGDRRHVRYLRFTDSERESGSVAPDTLSILPTRASVRTTDKPGFFPAVSRDGASFAIALSKIGTAAIRIITGKGERLLQPTDRTGTRFATVDSMTWNPDGSGLYAACTRKHTDATLDLGVCAVPLDGRPTRFKRLVGGVQAADGGTPVYRLMISLSPNGTMLAASTAHTPARIPTRQRAVYLLDLRTPDWNVQRIATP